MRDWVKQLVRERDLPDDGLLALLETNDAGMLEALRTAARAVCDARYGKVVFIRGLIEFTNFCRNDCLYCGIRRSNAGAGRYRLTDETVLDCCARGYALGFRTFVLQGGEDAHFTDERLCGLVRAIRRSHPDCAVTLSVGERSRESYARLFAAGAERYLLRHETATPAHYARLHPPELTLETRMRCLNDLREIGFQVGCGFMVGSPFQTDAEVVGDLRFIKTFAPHMVGIGPFIPHRDTPFGGYTAGSADKTLRLLSIVRLLLPDVLLPATTALGTVRGDGRELGILAGANVVMPNLSPADARAKYTLYNNKRCTGDEAAEHLNRLNARLNAIGYHTQVSRGDSRMNL